MKISTNIYKGGGGVQKVQNLVYVENGCPLRNTLVFASYFTPILTIVDGAGKDSAI